MRIEVAYFGPLKARTGRDAEAYELPEGATVGALLDACCARYPGLADGRASLLVAVDREFAGPDAVLRPRSEVALLPPLSGGRA